MAAGPSPAVSILVAVHNGERFIAETVDSALAQSFEDLELVVVDDGSTDATAEILAAYAEADRRVRVHRQAHTGVSAARNRGIEACRGPLIALLDGDDVMKPDRLRTQLRFLAENPDAGLVGGQVDVVDEDGRKFAEAAYPCDDAGIREGLQRSNAFVHSAVTVRTEVLRGVGGYRHLFVVAQDLDLWLRIAERSRLANLPQKVVSYRIHSTQASTTKIELQATMALAARESARRREQGLEDPIDGLAAIDERTLLAAGIAGEEIDREVVEAAVWIAKTAGRAGYEDMARELFAIARRRARKSSQPGSLLATIWGAQAQRLREQGRPLRALPLSLAARVRARGERGRRSGR